ncbi:hypothetical protein [Burkholderia ambifaria]|uniref:hypothetical protein n=1 Tax=Burkholderia ambifaria TaxID=152480 RepID=UPI00158E9235|nr:hypothetical protein [Burkholderia ambifaria]
MQQCIVTAITLPVMRGIPIRRRVRGPDVDAIRAEIGPYEAALRTASTAAVKNDAHRVIANDWLRRAIAGIRVMRLDDDERRRVARRLF